MAQARTEFAAALSQIASEKGVEPEVILDAIRSAALAAYKKDLTIRNEVIPDDIEEYTTEVDKVSGGISIFHDGKNVTPPGFARIAASIAKQVIMQRLYEAEKEAIMSEYENKVGTVISGSIQRQEGNIVFVDLGRAEGVMPPSEQVRGEQYDQHQRFKFFIKEIREGRNGPEVILSRADPNLVKGLFAIEVPEIQSGSVEIKEVAREAGGRCKVAAVSKQEGVDPVGSLVGQKGVRVQQVMSELGEEKIDIINFSEDPARFIQAALSPAKDVTVRFEEDGKVAKVKVPESQLPLAIGKGGQNVRLAARLTGWKIDIEGLGEPEVIEDKKNEDTSDESVNAKESKAGEEEASEGTGEKKEEAGTAPAQAAPTDDQQVASSDDTKEKPEQSDEEPGKSDESEEKKPETSEN